MKILQAWTHHETGIGTYNIVGLGDDGLIYQWETYGDDNYKLNTPEWKLKTE